jgi:hypothetical protein
MRNIKKIPTTWRQDENGEPIYIHFLGSEYLNECYEVCVRCAYFYKGGLYQRALNVAKNPVYHGYRAARWRHGHRPAFAT